MNIIILGANGQLGTELSRASWPHECKIQLLKRKHVDLAQPGNIETSLSGRTFDLLVNAAAYTQVDQAEKEQDLCMTVNRDAPAAMAATCSKRGVPFIHISTDYVFDGSKPEPYVEEDQVGPINVYGRSKAEGENLIRNTLEHHIILRTSWVYSPHGKNFVKSMLHLADERNELRIVNDQHGSPTSAADLAEVIVQIISSLQRGDPVEWGTYHYAGFGLTTWYGLADEALEAYKTLGGRKPVLVPNSTSEYPTLALRPVNARLNCKKIVEKLGVELKPWRESCRKVVLQLAQEKMKVNEL